MLFVYSDQELTLTRYTIALDNLNISNTLESNDVIPWGHDEQKNYDAHGDNAVADPEGDLDTAEHLVE